MGCLQNANGKSTFHIVNFSLLLNTCSVSEETREGAVLTNWKVRHNPSWLCVNSLLTLLASELCGLHSKLSVCL